VSVRIETNERHITNFVLIAVKFCKQNKYYRQFIENMKMG
jgi:hypothetical protein